MGRRLGTLRGRENGESFLNGMRVEDADFQGLKDLVNQKLLRRPLRCRSQVIMILRMKMRMLGRLGRTRREPELLMRRRNENRQNINRTGINRQSVRGRMQAQARPSQSRDLLRIIDGLLPPRGVAIEGMTWSD